MELSELGLQRNLSKNNTPGIIQPEGVLNPLLTTSVSNSGISNTTSDSTSSTASGDTLRVPSNGTERMFVGVDPLNLTRLETLSFYNSGSFIGGMYGGISPQSGTNAIKSTGNMDLAGLSVGDATMKGIYVASFDSSGARTSGASILSCTRVGAGDYNITGAPLTQCFASCEGSPTQNFKVGIYTHNGSGTVEVTFSDNTDTLQDTPFHILGFVV